MQINKVWCSAHDSNTHDGGRPIKRSTKIRRQMDSLASDNIQSSLRNLRSRKAPEKKILSVIDILLERPKLNGEAGNSQHAQDTG